MDLTYKKKYTNTSTLNNVSPRSRGQIGGDSTQKTNSSTIHPMEFPNGKETVNFDEFTSFIQESCSDYSKAENLLVLTFSMFDRQK